MSDGMAWDGMGWHGAGTGEPTNSGGSDSEDPGSQVGRGNACKSVGSSNPLASLLVLVIGQDLGDGRLLF